MVKMTPQVNDSFAAAQKKANNINKHNSRNYYKHILCANDKRRNPEVEEKRQLNDMIKLTPNAISMARMDACMPQFHFAIHACL